MGRLLTYTATLFAILVLLIIIARLVGERDANLALGLFGADVNQASQACWHDLCPGQTTLAAAETILSADRRAVALRHGETQWCWQVRLEIRWQGCAGQWGMPRTDPLEYVLLTPASDSFRLGNAMTLLGQPIYSEICVANSSDPSFPASFVADFLTFKNGIVVGGYQPHNPHQWAVSPNMAVFYVFYYPFSGNGSSWSGFKPSSKTPIACGAD